MREIIERFAVDGRPVSVAAVGNGHINSTWDVMMDTGRRYVLQKINHHVFRDVAGLMKNIDGVTRYLRDRTKDPRGTMNLVPTRDGALYVEYQGKYYRMYDYVPGSVCLMQAESPEVFRQSGVAFGKFQNQLADYPADTLTETIPHFHDTPDRYRQFEEARRRDARGRAEKVAPEIAFVQARRADMGVMTDMLRRGELPLRVTHNDTKLSNVLFDETTMEPLCVIDLDTIMPGLSGNDFGDAIRFGASTALEDEPDLGKVHLSMDYFSAFTEGFLSECAVSLSEAELNTLVWGAKLMTLECGMRFLTDHLNGDTYFHVEREGHNLDRARTQFRLVEEMEERWDELNAVVRDTAARYRR